MAGTDPHDIDADNDGIKDADEFVGCALNPDPDCTGTTALSRGTPSGFPSDVFL